MKEIKKCSISGIAFTLELEAFEMLNRYTCNLQETYKDDCDGDEIVADIEARIAELILSQHDNKNVVTKSTIDNILFQMGSIEDISDDSSNKETYNSPPRIPRRLYRDMTNAKLGGVCSGLAKYFDVDTIWVRLGMFAPLLIWLSSHLPFTHAIRWASSFSGDIFGVIILCYIVMWFVVPTARSPRQKLEMEGEKITIQSIKDTSTTINNEIDTKARSVIAEIILIFGKIILVCIKIIIGILLVVLIIAAGALVIAIMTSAIGGIFAGTSVAGVAISGMFVCLIPILTLIYLFTKLIASKKPSGKTFFVLLLLWIASITTCSLVAINNKDEIKDFKFSNFTYKFTPGIHSYTLSNEQSNQNNTQSFKFINPDSTKINSQYNDNNSVVVNIDGKRVIISTEEVKQSIEITVDID